MTDKLIILDRDGVINVDLPNYVKSTDEWELIPGSIEAIASLSRLGYRIVVATNQQGIGKGLYSVNTLNQLHEKLNRELVQLGGRIDAFFFCPHLASVECPCRKPNPGMLLEAAKRFGVNIHDCYVVGDSITDLLAANVAGAIPILVKTGKGELSASKIKSDSELIDLQSIKVFKDLHEFVSILVKQH